MRKSRIHPSFVVIQNNKQPFNFITMDRLVLKLSLRQRLAYNVQW